MISFLLLVALFVAIALGLLLPPLLRKSNPVSVDVTSLPIYREQLQELEADYANGIIAAAQFHEAEQELKRRLVEESRVVAPAVRDASRKPWLAVAIAIALPIVCFALYKLLGQPAAFIDPTAQDGKPLSVENITPQQFATMTQRLAVKLRDNPNDPTGWTMLAKAYMALGRGNDAVAAYERAVIMVPDNAALLVEYAHALATRNNDSFVGRPRELITQAIKLAPEDPRVLALAGSAAYEAKDFAAAIAHWEKLLTLVPKDADAVDEVRASINAARNAMGEKPIAAKNNIGVSGAVSLSDTLKDKIAPNDTLFIFARAAGANAPKMPLAVWRGTVKDLPKTFTLDDSMAMTPAMVISKFEQVSVEARISKSGNAIPQSGDLSAASVTAKPGATGIKLVIDRVLP